MKRQRILVGIGLGVVLIAGTAFAQREQGERFRFSVDVGAEYTDNRDSLPSALEEENTDFFVKPRVDVFLDTDRTVFDLFYAPSFRYRTDPNDLQNDSELQHDLGLNLRQEVSRRVVLRFFERFNLTDDPSLTEGGLTVRNDQSYILNRAEAKATFQASRQTELEVGAMNKLKRYEEERVADFSDEDQTDISAAATHKFSDTMMGDARLRYSMFGYDSPGSIDRDFDSILAAVGLRKALSATLKAGAEAGAQFQSYDDSGIDEDVQPYGQVWVQGKATPSLTLSGIVTHGLRDSDVYPFASQEYTQFRAIGGYALTENVSLGLDGTYRLSDYKDVVPSAAAGTPDGDETTIEVAGQVKVQIADNTAVRLVQRFEDVDSDVGFADLSFQRNSTSLVLSQQF